MNEINFNETVLEHEPGHNYFAVSTGERSMKSTIYKLAEKYPDECAIIAENDDGSIFAHVPKKWVRIKPPIKRNLTDEQREAISKRLNNSREQHN